MPKRRAESKSTPNATNHAQIKPSRTNMSMHDRLRSLNLQLTLTLTMNHNAVTPPATPTDDLAHSSPPSSAVTTVAAPSRQSLTRRGHFKSRLGCFSCKRRRVKCNEARPECSPCRRLALTCVYPQRIVVSSTPSTVSRSPSALSLGDLRFFHHFLNVGFPTLPLRGEKAWWECAAMSHNVSGLQLSLVLCISSHGFCPLRNLDSNVILT